MRQRLAELRRRAAAVHESCRGQGWYRLRTVSYVLGILVLGAVALPAKSVTFSEFGGILTILNQATEAWGTFLLSGPGGAANQICFWCVLLEVAWIGWRSARAVMGGPQFSLLETASRELPILALVSVGLLLWPQWSVFPMAPFIGIGEAATGLDNGLDPGGLLGAAFGMAQIFTSPKLFLNMLPVSPTFILSVFSMLVTFAGFGAIGIRAFFLTIEGNLLISIGPIPWAFGCWSVTAGFADNYIRVAATFGLEYMLFLFMVNVGSNMPQVFLDALEDISVFRQDLVFVWLMVLAASTVGWALVAIVLPGKLARSLVHLWSPGIERALRR